MAAGQLPIRFHELMQLSSLGVNQQMCSFANLTLESDRFVCIRDMSTSPSTINVVDVTKPQSQPLRLQVRADSAVMHPSELILAYRTDGQDGSAMYVYNLEMKQEVTRYKMPEAVQFWKWVSGSTVAIVTATAVYHWSIEGGGAPRKQFARHTNLTGCQIINYRVSKDQKWCVLIGISQREGGRIGGSIQLYSAEAKKDQFIEGHAAAFATYQVEGADAPSTLICLASRTASASKLLVTEVGKPERFQRKATDIYYPPDTQGDFPVAMQVSDKYKIVYMVTKLGYLHVFDLPSATTIYMNRISTDTIFVTAPHDATSGIMGVNRRGQVLSVTVDEENIIPYITNTLKNFRLAIDLSSRCGLPGADDLFHRQFEQLLQQGNYQAAAKVAANSPAGNMRNIQTIQRFQNAPAQPGQTPPVLQYFGVLLEKGKLNQVETLELARVVLAQGRLELINKWLEADKLECGEDLGDMLKQRDLKAAMLVYYRGNVSHKVVQLFAETGQYAKIVQYCKRTGYSPDWRMLMQGVLNTQPQRAKEFADMLVQGGEGGGEPLMNVDHIIDLFMSRNMLQETTTVLLEYLKENKPEHGPLQTRLIELNIMQQPKVADALLNPSPPMFTHYDRPHVAQLCEQAGLNRRALEHYSALPDVKRVLVKYVLGQAIEDDFMVSYFGNLSVGDGLEALAVLLKQRHNVKFVTTAMGAQFTIPQLAARIASEYSAQMTPAALIKLFEDENCFDGMYYFLGQAVTVSDDPTIHNNYIMAAARIGDLAAVESTVSMSSSYEPEVIKEFLMNCKLNEKQQGALITVCDRFGFIEDMTKFFYKRNMMQNIELYVQQVNGMNTPQVVASLLDLQCNEEYIKRLVMSARNTCPVPPLVEQVEQRNRLKLILDWLEARAEEGNNEPALFNALAKIYIDDSSKDPSKFLVENQFYESRTVGKYAESRDPHLAFIAYKRGRCDEELVAVTNENGLYKNQARYLVERQDAALWDGVLKPDNVHRPKLIAQVIQTALPESDNPEEVSGAVRAFMDADLQNELIELLEKIVLETTKFSTNVNLQNLLILTAVKADKSRVMNYIQRLNQYDSRDIANICVSSGLYEEAFTVYKKFNHTTEAVAVLIEQLQDLERAYDFAEQLGDDQVFTRLALAQLEQNKVKPAIQALLKAKNHEHFELVIAKANEVALWEELIKYLDMCRQQIKHPKIETELMYAYAMTDNLASLQELISSPNVGQIQEVGDRCFQSEMYKAAKLLYNSISNFPRLCSCLIKLGDWEGAVEAARKASSTRTWKEVNVACVENGKFRLAQICGIQLMQHGDELEDLIRHYEQGGYFDEILELLEKGMGNDRSHVTLYTCLAMLYSKYRPEKLMEHLKLYHSRINIPRCMRVCEDNKQYVELTYLQIQSDDPDSAILTMVSYPEAFDHILFQEVIKKVTNVDVHYKALRFYLEQHPLQVVALLTAQRERVDNRRVVQIAQDKDRLPLVKRYLQTVQEDNNASVNEALNTLYIEEEDYESLRESVDTYDNFNALALAKAIQGHELLEFRRIAAYLYKINGKHEESVKLSKGDNLWRDAMETVANCKDRAVAEDLLKYFLENDRPDCFAACLYNCYDFIRPDVAMELAWKTKNMEYCMPYLVQVLREYTSKIDELEKLSKEKAESEETEIEGTTVVPQHPPLGVQATGYMVGPQQTGMMPQATGYGMQQMPQYTGFNNAPGGGYPQPGGGYPAPRFG
mmetsp:Transcript_13917/g.39575  ORF Transcript_13917/g.39575 Transcript_13917/m.39575 type:complete len:1722 (+) Transcript_13917:173-5338(+)